MKDIAIDAYAAYSKILTTLDDNGALPVDPTNPYAMLLELVTRNLASSNESLFLYERRHYAVLSENKSELFRFLSDEDSESLFATPADGKFTFLINVNTILDYGVKVDDEYKFTIPKYTTITVDGIVFTVIGDINCSLGIRDNRFYTFVENKIDDTRVRNRNVGNVVSNVIKDVDGTDYLVFEVLLTQVKVSYYVDMITKNVVFNKSVPITDKYYTSIVEHKVNDMWESVNKIYVESIFDPEIPSMYVGVGDKEMQYNIPQVYIDRNILYGDVGIYVYETKGSMNLDLSTYKQDDFKLSINTSKVTKYGIAATSLGITIRSKDVVINGTNVPDFRVLKKKVIKRCTGTLDIPITEYQLEEFNRLEGYKLTKQEDGLLNRMYVATRDIKPTNVYNIKPDLFMASVNIEAVDRSALQDTIGINDKYLMVRPDTLFRLEGNVFKPLTKLERLTLDSMHKTEAISYIVSNKVMYTPYYYIMGNEDTVIDTRAYDVTTPELLNPVIDRKNNEVNINVNTVNRVIFNSLNDDGYVMFFTVLGNKDFETNKNKVKLLFVIENTIGGSIKIVAEQSLLATQEYFPNATEAYYKVTVNVSEFINKDDTLSVSNGITNSLRTIFDNAKSKVILYTDDSTIINTANTSAMNFLLEDEKEHDGVLGFTVEDVELKTIDGLKFLWNKAISYFTPRRYVRHTVDIPMRYKEDIYENFQSTGCEVGVYDDDNDGVCDRYEINKLHAMGDVVTINGEPVIKHHKGEVMYDANNLPIEDVVSGIVRNVDMLLLDYLFIYLGSENYIRTMDTMKTVLKKVIKEDMSYLNGKTLDNTIIKFKPIKDITDVVLVDEYDTPAMISPIVTIYLDKDSVNTLPSMPILVEDIGNIINKYLDKVFIDVQIIEDAIKEKYKAIKLLSIKNISLDDRRYISLKKGSNRFSLLYKVDTNFRIVYDLSIDINYV